MDKMTVEETIQRFQPIALAEMREVRLLNRIDTKYVTTVEKLVSFLKNAENDYFVQETGGIRLLPYHTIYLDTPELSMYYDHQRGKSHRFKIRMRQYEASGDMFLEVKNKSNRGRTRKKREEIDCLSFCRQDEFDFIDNFVPYSSESLQPIIENKFERITLVNKNKTERLTIDLDIQFHNLLNDNTHNMPQYAVIEIKRDGLVPSPAIAMFRELRIKPVGFSKMALGMAMTDSSLKQNLFKERIHQIERIGGGC